MSWKKHFQPASTHGHSTLSPLSNTSGKSGPAKSNYSSFLPDVYTGAPNRVERYMQYETMDADSEVNAALDIIAEFCSQKNKENLTPFSLWFKTRATNAEVTILREYLQQWCKLQQFETRMFRIVRNTFKNGDAFFIRDPETQKWHYIDPSKIVKIIVNESDGKEPEQYIIKDLAPNFVDLVAAPINPMMAGQPGRSANFTASTGGRGMTGTFPTSGGSRFSSSQNEHAIDAKHIVHLSLSEGLDNNFPFGNSLFENIFKVFKQKELLEDAIIIYRVQRAPERRVFYIDVGSMPSHLAMSFVERVKNEVNQRRIPSSSGGANVIDSAYNPLGVSEDYFFPQTCLSLDTVIPLLDGRELSLAELIDEYDNGHENWVYGLSNKTFQVERAKIEWAGITRRNARVLKIILDNGNAVTATPDHRFILLDGAEVEAVDLVVGDKLMPFNMADATETRSVANIEVCDELINTGDITISSVSNSHWFALSSGIYVHNSEGRGSKVETLPGGCFAMDTRVSLLDGRELSIAEIRDEMATGKELWTYSCEPKTGAIVPGLISWAGVTQKSAKVMRLTLDNGNTIICTPDHKFPIYNSEEKMAGDFVVGESLIPLHRRKEPVAFGGDTYEQVFDNATKKWVFTHRLVSDYLKDSVVKYKVPDETVSDGKYQVRHHVDYNRYNNDPNNLVWMNSKDHIHYHRANIQMMHAHNKYVKENDPVLHKEICDKKAAGSVISWKNHTEEEYDSRCEKIGAGVHNYIENLSKEEREARAERSRAAFKLGHIKFNEMMAEDLAYRKAVIDKRMLHWTEENRAQRSEFMTEQNKAFWAGEAGEARREKQKALQSVDYSHAMLLAVIDLVKGKTTHQVTANDVVNELNNNIPLLTELRELNQFKKVRNWSLNDGFTATGLANLVKRFGYENWKDFRVKESIHNHRVVKIEYLDEEIEVGTLTIDGDERFHNYHNFALSAGVIGKNSNLGEIDDLRFFTNKLFRGLRIPSSYLPTGSDDSQSQFNDGRVGTAYIQELRFNNYCQRLQSLIQDNFDQEFKLYLYARGVNIDSSMFELKLQPPQNFATYRQAELDNQRAPTFQSMSQIPFLSKRFALKRFLGLSDEEVAENERMWSEENGKGKATQTDSSGELRGAGISQAGIQADVNAVQNDIEMPNAELPGGLATAPDASMPAAGGVAPAASPVGSAPQPE